MTLLSQTFINAIREIIVNAQKHAVTAIQQQRVLMYWHIGHHIVEEEQQGKTRADYGSELIKTLSKELTKDFGSGFSFRQLNFCRQFFIAFPIMNALRSQLNWTQYRLLLRIESEDKRTYYIEESCNNNWSARQLERQINSQLYERLLLSNDKEKVLAIAKKEAIVEHPKDIIKDPMVLEFLGLQPQASYYEKDLEQLLISNIQSFLLELGNGFSFVSRQKRIQIEDDEYFVDLVFYNRLLKCFVIIEIKTHKLTHQDLGQLQMYVNYYDRTEKQQEENNTIGILLCTDKNNTMVEFALPEKNATILASQYQLYLPKKEEITKAISHILEDK
ncbi:PDDEXK nuclease domain-containing protein [uncultured Polaribacter sp.]|uniref:PDDEXK nuclease domain-containing protein n=1 Tax=uncultured Polaribacter sp. TaxID=174711 RepID=UPI0026085D7D|nr:PDDEXK nuclease domain-containing protein [uncultured Polaribacter sp.]